jgi:hypothetical protein
MVIKSYRRCELGRYADYPSLLDRLLFATFGHAEPVTKHVVETGRCLARQRRRGVVG